MSATLSDLLNTPDCQLSSKEFHRKRTAEARRKFFAETEAQYVEPELKQCNGCGEWKDVEEFPQNKHKLATGDFKWYRKSKCRKCEAVRTVAWRKRNFSQEEWNEYEREGRKRRKFRSKRSSQSAGEERLDPEPIRKYLIDNNVIETVTVTSSHITNIKNGKDATVGLDVVDRILQEREDQVLMHELYPLD